MPLVQPRLELIRLLAGRARRGLSSASVVPLSAKYVTNAVTLDATRVRAPRLLLKKPSNAALSAALTGAMAGAARLLRLPTAQDSRLPETHRLIPNLHVLIGNSSNALAHLV